MGGLCRKKKPGKLPFKKDESARRTLMYSAACIARGINDSSRFYFELIGIHLTLDAAKGFIYRFAECENCHSSHDRCLWICSAMKT